MFFHSWFYQDATRQVIPIIDTQGLSESVNELASPTTSFSLTQDAAAKPQDQEYTATEALHPQLQAHPISPTPVEGQESASPLETTEPPKSSLLSLRKPDEDLTSKVSRFKNYYFGPNTMSAGTVYWICQISLYWFCPCQINAYILLFNRMPSHILQ